MVMSSCNAELADDTNTYARGSAAIAPPIVDLHSYDKNVYIYLFVDA